MASLFSSVADLVTSFLALVRFCLTPRPLIYMIPRRFIACANEASTKSVGDNEEERNKETKEGRKKGRNKGREEQR